MEHRHFAHTGISVSRLGLGCMGMSEFYGSGHADSDQSASIATIHRALDFGVNFLDTADIYGVGRNEELVGKAIAGRREEVFLATKFGNVRSAGASFLASTASRSTCARRAKPVSNVSMSMSSTFIISIASIQTRQLKIPSAQWRNWSRRAKFAF